MDISEPVVSVIIPVYNGENYLAEAIDSVLAQTFRDFELIVIDDGSQDGTWAIIQGYGDQVRGLRKENGGVATALNTGIRTARGEYVAWLSHDDRFLPNKLAVEASLLNEHPESVGVYSDYQVIDSEGQVQSLVRVPHYLPTKMMRHLLQTCFINGSTLLVRRDQLIEAGLFNESIRLGNDSLMWLALARRYPFLHCAQPMTQYRVHKSQSSQYRKVVQEDNRRWLAQCFRDFSVKDFFPELTECASDEAVARAYIYLGEVLLRIYLLGDQARAQFLKSLQYPSRYRLRALYQVVKSYVWPVVIPVYAGVRATIWRLSSGLDASLPLFPPGEFNMAVWAERVSVPVIECGQE